MAAVNFSATAAALATFQRVAPESRAWPSASASKTRLSAAEAALAAFFSCSRSQASSDASSTRASSGTHTPCADAQQSPQRSGIRVPPLRLSGLRTSAAHMSLTERTGELQNVPRSARFNSERPLEPGLSQSARFYSERSLEPGVSQSTRFHSEVARQLEQYRADALEASTVKLEKQLLDSELVLGDKDRMIASLQAALKAKDNLIAALEDEA